MSSGRTGPGYRATSTPVEEAEPPGYDPDGPGGGGDRGRGVCARAGAAGDVPATVDHDPARVCASTGAGTLELREDAIGLHAELTVTDGEVIRRARRGEIKGWSFGMKNVQAELEERADGLPLRRVKAPIQSPLPRSNPLRLRLG